MWDATTGTRLLTLSTPGSRVRAVAFDPEGTYLLTLHESVPGIVVPERLRDELERAGASAADVGFERARELVAASRDVASGVYVVAPFRRPLAVVDLL